MYGCAVFEKLFNDYLGDKDVAITLAPAPFGASRNYAGAFRAGFPASYAEYTERNLGLHMLATGKPVVQKLLALFRDVYIRQANDTEHVSIGNDQCAFREVSARFARLTHCCHQSPRMRRPLPSWEPLPSLPIARPNRMHSLQRRTH